MTEISANGRSILDRIRAALGEADPVRGLTITELQHRVAASRASVDVAVKRAVTTGDLVHAGHVVKMRKGLQPAKLYRLAGGDVDVFHVEHEPGVSVVPEWRRARAVDRVAAMLMVASPERGMTVGELADALELDAKTVRAAVYDNPKRFVWLREAKRKGCRAAKTYGLAADYRRTDGLPARPLGGRPSPLDGVAA